ncbi:histidine phosphatase family protein, partial [Candidatus Woesearchaeota archaeon]|nr:histidine phosphatase family protein [Candidatus Woesearchaeota archaeon]
GAETKLNIYMRASEFLREIYAKHTDETILLVGHNGINKALIHAITNQDPEKLLKKHSNTLRFGNTSVSIFTIDDKSYEIELLNCTEHLE